MKETPTNPFANSPDSTNRASTVSNMSRLEIPQPARSNPRPSPPRNSSSARISSNPFERSTSTDLSFSRPGSSYSEVTPRGRQTYQPRRSSHLRFSNAPDANDMDALATLEGRELASKLGSKASQGELLRHSHAASRGYQPVPRTLIVDGISESAESAERSNTRSSDESWSASSGDSSLRHPAGLRRHNPSSSGSPESKASKYGRYESSDLDSLASHRKSHVAETGQLFPRIRVNGSTGEWTSVQQPAEHNNFLSTSPVSPLEPSDPFATPHLTPLPLPERGNEPPTFEEFVRSTSPPGQFYPGADGIPLQEQHGNTRFTASNDGINQTQRSRLIKEANHENRAGETYQMKNLQRKRQDSGGRKESLFSEAV